MLTQLLQLTASGLLLGGIYALNAMGLTLIFGVMQIINFAHGEFLMLAMYAAFFLAVWIGMDPYVSIVVVAPLFFGLGLFFQRFMITGKALMLAPAVLAGGLTNLTPNTYGVCSLAKSRENAASWMDLASNFLALGNTLFSST